MLPIDQITPFIRHEDPWVADLALDCLKWVRLPMRLAGDFVLDAVHDGHPQLRLRLDDFEISPAVLDEAIETVVKKPLTDDNFWAQQVIAAAPDQLLTPEKADKIRRLKFDRSWVGTRIRTKLKNLSLSTEQLRDRLVELCEEADREMSAMSEQHDISAVADSLADRRDVDWAMEKLGHLLGANKWIETWLFSVLAKASYRPAFDVALKRFAETNPDENEALVSELARGIPQWCEPADVDRLSSLWDRCPVDSRGFYIEAIGHLRFPEIEPFLLRITEASDDPFIRASGAMSLCEMLCPLEEFRQFMIRIIEEGDYDASLVDLRELAVPLGTILGTPFPKQDQWREHLISERARLAARLAMFRGNLMDWNPPAKPPVETVYPQRPQDIGKLTTTKTVGRNDPCPCGSGKKYKKCCLLKE